jgi:predicted alpha/beta hydrolase
MCMRCRNTENDLREYVTKHAAECPGKAAGEPCAVPDPATNYQETAWWLLALVHMCFDVTLDRMDKARDLFDMPNDIPADVLREWEEHTQKAATYLGKARYAREARERGASDDRRVQ